MSDNLSRRIVRLETVKGAGSELARVVVYDAVADPRGELAAEDARRAGHVGPVILVPDNGRGCINES